MRDVTAPVSIGPLLGGIAQGTDGSVSISAYGFNNMPVTVGARYTNGQFSTLVGEDPFWVGPPNGPLAITNSNVAYFASSPFSNYGVNPPFNGSFVWIDGNDPGEGFTILWPGTISDVAADKHGNIWYIMGCPCSQDVPYSFLAEGPQETNPPGNLVVQLAGDGSSLQALAVSPDANTVWVANGGSIDRVSATGTILQTYVLPPGTSIGGMAAQSDSSVWFTDSGNNDVVSLSSAGTFAKYPVPTKASGLDRITVGGDGALWFSETRASKIGRITPQGTMREYATPTANAGPTGIAGPNGAGCNPDVIWFVEQSAGKIAEITIQP